MRSALRAFATVTATVALLVMPEAVLSHVELIASSPQAGDNLDTPPSEVSVTFGGELDPDLSRFTVADADGTEVGSGAVDLTVADRNVLRGDVTITDPGVYTVDYTVAGIDGHMLEGTFSFGYQALETVPGPSGQPEPDTAMPAPQEPVALLAGIALLATGGMLALRRLVRA